MQLTPEQTDALQEIVNIGVGRAASMLNQMIDSRIILDIPYIKVLCLDELQQELAERFNDECFAAVRLGFKGSFSGVAELVFPTESASNLVALLTGEDVESPDLDALKIGTLSEIGNIVINGVMGSISNVLKQHMNYGIPMYMEDSIQNLVVSENLNDQTILLAQARFTIEQLEIMGDIILLFELNSFDTLVAAINQELNVAI